MVELLLIGWFWVNPANITYMHDTESSGCKINLSQDSHQLSQNYILIEDTPCVEIAEKINAR